MNRRRFLQISAASASLALHSGSSAWSSQSRQQSQVARGWLIYADKRLGKHAETLVQRILFSAKVSPLLAALSAGKSAATLDLSAPQKQLTQQLAYNHVILIALPGDPLLVQAWQREATLSSGALYAFGFGHFHGSVGYIESDRNPFLHSHDIPKAPFESHLITITGTNNEGIDTAMDAFLGRGLISGVVARDGEWSRPAATLLDRNPLPPSFQLPAIIPAALGNLRRIAVTQASEEEYRGVLADAGIEPLWIWRSKYYEAGQWDAPGADASFHNYSVGLHRRAYGNTLWAATFANESDASRVAPAIAKAANLSAAGPRWQGNQPPYSWPDPAVPPVGTLELWVDGSSVLMASRTIA